MSSERIKIIQAKSEDFKDKLKQRKGYELEQTTTVDISRKFDPRKKWDRVSTCEQVQEVGRGKSYFIA
jgi:hypothetical protein